MSTADLCSQFRMPSLLAVDLALARLDLAALRARRGVEEVDEEARDSAELLRDFFNRQLRMSSGSTQISEALDESVRQAIKESLASVTEAKPIDEGDAELMRHLVELLSAVAKSGHWKPGQAKELHSALRQLDAKRATPCPRTDETKLRELFNAFS
jgi:hypothetical protein